MTKRINNDPRGDRHPDIENASNPGPSATLHFLVTLHTFDGVTLNGYLVTDEDRHLTPTCDVLMQKAAELNLHPMPAFLATKMDSGIGVVEDAINRRKGPKIDFTNRKGLVVWATRDDDPINEKLMELH